MAYPTNPIYKLQKNKFDGSINSVSKRVGITTQSIPFDPDNTDYQEYLKWVEAGNTAEAAD